MKREIKFRAWDNSTKTMIYPSIDGLSSGELLDRYENIMQFTGLQDKDGNDIYEGDVVGGKSNNVFSEGTYSHNVVGYVEPSARFHAMGTRFENLAKFLYYFKNPKVIGNIHDNPELLNK